MRDCEFCGEEHRTMETCPEAPGLLDLLRGWGSGERTAHHYVAVAGVIAFATLAIIIAMSV